MNSKELTTTLFFQALCFYWQGDERWARFVMEQACMNAMINTPFPVLVGQA